MYGSTNDIIWVDDQKTPALPKLFSAVSIPDFFLWIFPLKVILSQVIVIYYKMCTQALLKIVS